MPFEIKAPNNFKIDLEKQSILLIAFAIFSSFLIVFIVNKIYNKNYNSSKKSSKNNKDDKNIREYTYSVFPNKEYPKDLKEKLIKIRDLLNVKKNFQSKAYKDLEVKEKYKYYKEVFNKLFYELKYKDALQIMLNVKNDIYDTKLFEEGHDWVQYFFINNHTSAYCEQAPFIDINLFNDNALKKEFFEFLDEEGEKEICNTALDLEMDFDKEIYIKNKNHLLSITMKNIFDKLPKLFEGLPYGFEKLSNGGSSDKVFNYLINSPGEHNQNRITRMIESLYTHLSLGILIKSYFLEKITNLQKTDQVPQVKQIIKQYEEAIKSFDNYKKEAKIHIDHFSNYNKKSSELYDDQDRNLNFCRYQLDALNKFNNLMKKEEETKINYNYTLFKGTGNEVLRN